MVILHTIEIHRIEIIQEAHLTGTFSQQRSPHLCFGEARNEFLSPSHDSATAPSTWSH